MHTKLCNNFKYNNLHIVQLMYSQLCNHLPFMSDPEPDPDPMSNPENNPENILNENYII